MDELASYFIKDTLYGVHTVHCALSEEKAESVFHGVCWFNPAGASQMVRSSGQVTAYFISLHKQKKWKHHVILKNVVHHSLKKCPCF